MDDLLFMTLALLGSIVSFLSRPLELGHWVHVKAAHAPLDSLPATLPGSESLPPPESERMSDPAPAPGLATA